MTKSKGKKPTNKDRDKTLVAHESALRQLIPQFNQLYGQVQDFFAIFSMFVEHLGKDDSFGKFVEAKMEEAKKQEEESKNEKSKIVDSKGDPVKSSRTTNFDAGTTVENS
jgi:hypothetical protein